MADSRMDLILKKLNGEDVELVPPMSRIEKIYFKLLGYDIELDPPQSRSEVLLTEYVNNGGGGGGSSDFSYINVTFINSATNNSSYNVMSVQTDDEYGVFFDMIASVTTEVTVPLLAYKGRIVLFLYNFDQVAMNVAPVVMGDVVFDDDQWSFTITGECSITLKSMAFM